MAASFCLNFSIPRTDSLSGRHIFFTVCVFIFVSGSYIEQMFQILMKPSLSVFSFHPMCFLSVIAEPSL